MKSKRIYVPDLLIILPTILLMSLGILVIYTSSPQLAATQAVVAAVGLCLFWFVSSINYEFYGVWAKHLYIIALFLLIIVFILGVETRGSVRWVWLGAFNLQPSELAKLAIIISLARFWSLNYPTWANIFKSLAIISPIIFLVFMQPDLGTTIVMLFIWIMALIAANVSIFKMVILICFSAVFTPLAWVFLKEYQRDRLLGFLSPHSDPLGVGYNAIQSTIAVGSGQLLGRGLGTGTQSRLQFLPEFRTDFIFASIAEELGFIGASIMLLLYFILITRCLKILSLSNNKFGNSLIMGVLGMLFIQVVVNIGMNIGIMPITGITLPLISYGGSSLIVTLISLGLVASVKRYSQRVS